MRSRSLVSLTAVLNVHDRCFLDRLATHFFAFKDDGYVEWLDGNFEAYGTGKKRRFGVDRLILHRSKFRKFGR